MVRLSQRPRRAHQEKQVCRGEFAFALSKYKICVFYQVKPFFKVNLLNSGRTSHYNTLGDGPDTTIFDTQGLSEWRPNLLVSKDYEYSNLFPYLTTYRDNTK